MSRLEQSPDQLIIVLLLLEHCKKINSTFEVGLTNCTINYESEFSKFCWQLTCCFLLSHSAEQLVGYAVLDH